MILLALLVLGLQTPAPARPAPARPLYAGGTVHESIAPGESAVFAIEVPASTAARIVARQEGIDLTLKLRRQGSDVPIHGLDFVAGHDGDEVMYPAILDAPATWTLVVSVSLPNAARGDYTLMLELAPADDQARAIAAARGRHYAASEISWLGDGVSRVKARDEYAGAAADALAAGDIVQAAESTYQSARERDQLGDAPDAVVWQRRALELFRQAGRRDREARVLNRLGDLSRKLGEVADSDRYFRQALPLARAVDDPATVADILNNSGLLMMSNGRWEESIAQFESALPLARAIDSANVETALHNNMGEAYKELGDFEKAIDAYQQALVSVARLRLPRRTARTLNLIAANYYRMGDFAKADTTIRQSLELFEQANDPSSEAEALAFAARLRYTSGDLEEADGLFARAVPVLQKYRSRLAVAKTLTEWAEVDVARGQIDAALEKTDAALPIARALAVPDSEAETLWVKALALSKTDRIADAVAAAAGAVAIVENQRGAIRRSDLRSSYLSTVSDYYDLYIELLQRQGSADAAFEVSERAHARTLLEGLAASASKILKGVDPALLARQRALQEQLNAKEARRVQLVASDGDKSPAATAAARDIAQSIDELTRVRTAIQTSSPGYAALQMPEPIGVERVQRSLVDAETALVEYHLGAARSYVWVVDRGSVTVRELAPGPQITAAARRYHELLSRETDALGAAAREKIAAEIAAAGRALAQSVWQPIERCVAGKRILVVADGALQFVPFAALPTSSGEPVLAGHEVAYLPSASVLDTIRRDRRPARPALRAAVFADPVFSRNDPRLAAARDVSAPAQSRAADGGLYGRLRFSRREAEAIAAVAPGTFEALDFDAAKQTFLARDLRQYRILHFATHGTLNTDHPELSGLVFSLVDKNGKAIDGFLRLHEIYNLDLDADLVVLSACRTALGKEVHGEGLIGLTRGFMYAGASRVVSSVWNVDDRASSQLMSRFYTEMLTNHLTPAAALRAAQLSMLREPRWSNPHYWAAFGLHGEWK